jgi:hypothetical protein
VQPFGWLPSRPQLLIFKLHLVAFPNRLPPFLQHRHVFRSGLNLYCIEEMSTAQIAEKYGCGKTTVVDRLNGFASEPA